MLTDLDERVAQQAMIARRLQSWLASEPTPDDIVDTLYEVAQRLDGAVPGGLADTSGRLVLATLCRCLLYCELDDFLAAWPRVRRGQV